MVGYLVAEEGPLTGLVIRMEEGDEWLLGRDPSVCYQVLEDPMVSRKHVICKATEEGFVVENLSSTNPASVNGVPILEPTVLQEADILQIGSTLFRFTEQDPHLLIKREEKESASFHPTIFEEETPLDSLSLNTASDARWMLKVISGPNTGAEFGLETNQTYILGKDPHSCEIIFQDLSVSRQHAKIIVTDEENVLLEDLKSRNGTYVNGKAIEQSTKLDSQDLVSLGTTSFLIIDRHQSRETIYSPTSALSQAYEKKEEEIAEQTEAVEEKKDWKELFIPTRHLILAGTFLILILAGIVSTLSLFKSQTVEMAHVDEEAEIGTIISRFPGVEFSFNKPSGKVFLLGDVLTEVEKQELLYLVRTLPFVTSIEDNVMIDEIIWSDINAFLSRNPNWRAVSMTAYSPGKFVLKGYVQTLEEASKLMEYVNLNFPYNEKLENQVVVANSLEIEIQNMLIEKGFVNMTFQLTAGELILAGRVNEQMQSQLNALVQELRKITGIRSVKNFVILTSASTARINISDKYRVTGTSKFGNMNQYVVINGQILTVGDALDGMVITHMEADSLFLEKDGLKYRINYNQQ